MALVNTLLGTVQSTMLFPGQINYRPLRDILFRSSESLSNGSVVASFHPTDASPTLASPPLSGISKILFLSDEGDAVVGNPFQSHENYFVPDSVTPVRHTVTTRHPVFPDLDLPDASIRQAKSIDPAQFQRHRQTVSVNEERWAWPSKSNTDLEQQEQEKQKQGRQLNAKQQLDVPLTVKKIVPKPYRNLAKISSCPKLLHDLNITCELPIQTSEPVVSCLKVIQI